MIHLSPRLVSRRQFLVAAGASATALIALNGCRSGRSPSARNARPGRLFFTSQGRTGILNADGTGLRYFDFKVPKQVAHPEMLWQIV